MFKGQKLAFRQYCKEHRRLYRLFSGWFERRTNRALRAARREKGIDRNLVVFSAYNMSAYNDNPFYISQALHETRPRTEIAWLFRDVEAARQRFDIPDYVRCLGWKTPEGNEALGRARVIVDNWQKPDWLRLGRKQIYLFSPHHDRSFKAGLFIRRDRLRGRVVEARASAATTGSEFCKRFLREAYHCKGPYLDGGLPRNDILVKNRPGDAARILAKLGLDGGARLLLFAPTYRDADQRSGARQAVCLDLNRVLDALEDTFGGRWLCLYRAHYLSAGLDLKAGEAGRLIDVTGYPEMSELLRVADALLTDYSCCAGDFLLRRKPIWLYVADLDDYTAYSRELYLNPLDTPYWSARDPEGLDRLIRQTTAENARENCEAVLNFYGAHESGKATDLAVNYICAALE